jgi:hypothetical protein
MTVLLITGIISLWLLLGWVGSRLEKIKVTKKYPWTLEDESMERCLMFYGPLNLIASLIACVNISGKRSWF